MVEKCESDAQTGQCVKYAKFDTIPRDLRNIYGSSVLSDALFDEGDRFGFG